MGRDKSYSLPAKTDDSLAGIHNQAQQCVEEASSALQNLQDNIKTLGAGDESTDSNVTQAKKDLTHNIDETGARLASCQALLLETTTLLKQIKDLQTDQLKDYLFARSQPIWIALGQVLVAPLEWRHNLAEYLDTYITHSYIKLVCLGCSYHGDSGGCGLRLGC